ncbi:branched-chain amino acid transport system II carrier protein [Cellulophaga sp. HaHaR_3_176]|uniref:branched-chain amino acid transport system II carrier protein n=1 Tax=Cellulophaga sp. HaHaR_3_176 TaxID=1942464 RepID=UPI001C1F36F4|nr:branched-chain amino acid transport system II carrier protein [Cellulophaga sp. HaHaR_3_176]QWX83727.1 branched-chain amino acid transport system II carrier protein [Cellulophaga sp. HaHaR_3_176]
MHQTKKILVTTFAVFSLFFGAGNLIFPPLLGYQSGEMWWLVAIGFCLSAVLIPIFGILAHAKLQGTIFDFGKKVSPKFSLVYSILIYAISISLPSPRTASVTHEIAIQPFFNFDYIITSICYFSLVFIFVINRSKILNILGKLLTPAIILILLIVISITLFSFDLSFGETLFANPFSNGIREGYQTFDAIGAVVVGGVIIVSINLSEKGASYEEKKDLIRKAGFLAGIALLLIYTGLILTGAVMHKEFSPDVTRIALLNGVSTKALGNNANLILSILVSLACFTTAVGIVAGTADFMKHLFKESNKAYLITAISGCVLGVVMGQFDVNYIITIALPALMFIYPITIVLILLNVAPDKFASAKVFRVVIVITMLFSIPDFLDTVGLGNYISTLKNYIPFAKQSMGWVLPAFIGFVATNLTQRFNHE